MEQYKILILAFFVLVLSFIDCISVVCLQSLKDSTYQYCSYCDVSGGYADCSLCPSSVTYCQVSKGQCTCNAGYAPITVATDEKKQGNSETAVNSNVKKNTDVFGKEHFSI